jgi:5-methylcytosine-specific restriction endonuclease McrA
MPDVERKPKGSPRQRGYGGSYQSRRGRVLLGLLARQGGACWLCGKPIDVGLCWPDRMSISLDHVDTTRGPGFNSIANWKAAHLGCNSSRGRRER